MKKWTAVLMTLVFVLSLGASALASDEPDTGGGLGTELQNAGVVSASGEGSSEASEEPKDITVVEGDQRLTTLRIAENERLEGPNGETVTMTVDGVQRDMTEGETFTGDIRLTLTDPAELLGPNMGSSVAYEQRAALYIRNGQKVDSLSVDAAVDDGVIRSEGANFNGIMLTGDDGSTADVSGYTIDLRGWGENDMGGVGAAVYAVGTDMTANISDCLIYTRGATRTAFFTGGDAVVNIRGTHVYTYGGELPPGTGDLNNMEVPWMLGLIGTCRANNALGGTRTTWYDSSIVAYDWGALSTDSIGSAYAAASVQGASTEMSTHNTYVCTLYSGYGAYADGGAVDRFYDSCFDVADIAVIMTGSGEGSFDGSYVNAGSNAVMVHAGGGGVINAIDSEFHVGGTAFLIKDSEMTINIENSTFAFDGTAEFDPALAQAYGVDVSDPIFDYETYSRSLYNDLDATNIVKVQHNADAGSGSDAAQSPVVVNVTDSVLEGDFLNSCADVLTVTTFMMGNAVTRDRPARGMEVCLNGSELTGAVSLAEDSWDSSELVTVSGGVNEFNYACATELGFYTDGVFGLYLTLTDSVWNVTRDSYLTKLVIGESSTVCGTMTVDGEAVEPVPGVYEGEIVVSPLLEEEIRVFDLDGELFIRASDLKRALGVW